MHIIYPKYDNGYDDGKGRLLRDIQKYQDRILRIEEEINSE